MKILIVEDEKELLQSISDYLERDEIICESASNYNEAEDKIVTFNYEIVVLDITLPDGNGLDLIKLIKEIQPDTRILIVSAKASLDDKINGLNLGADDYITKPFHLAELNSRINAIIRRKNYNGKNEVQFNEIVIDVSNHQVMVHLNELQLTRKEYDLLLYLVINKNKVLTKESIAEHLWGDHIGMADNFDFVYTHIKNLRKKIEFAGGADYLRTIYGMGYKFSEK